MTIKKKFFKIPKIVFFAKDLPMLLVKKCNFFLYLFPVKKSMKKCVVSKLTETMISLYDFYFGLFWKLVSCLF